MPHSRLTVLGDPVCPEVQQAWDIWPRGLEAPIGGP